MEEKDRKTVSVQMENSMVRCIEHITKNIGLTKSSYIKSLIGEDIKRRIKEDDDNRLKSLFNGQKTLI